MPEARHATVVHAWFDRVQREPHALAVRVVDRSGEATELSHAELYRLAGVAARELRGAGLGPGDRLLMALPTCPEFFPLYVAALSSGIVPLIDPAPRSPAAPDGEGRLAALAQRVGARYAVVPGSARESVDTAGVLRLLAAEELVVGSGQEPLEPKARGDDVAHLQLTSGSTGRQKVAVVRHRNIVANISGIGQVIGLRPDDSLMFWLPLFHDMGLIAVSCALFWQRPMTVTDASNFVRHPIRFWWQLMSRFRATITAAPNSAYEACARLARLRRFDGLDLSSCRVAFWGSEPVHWLSILSFQEAFAAYGYRPEVTLPVYGLAEATLAATVPSPAKRPTVDRLEPEALRRSAGQAGVGVAGRPREVVSVGRALPGHQVRIVDGAGRLLPEGAMGEIEVAGPAVIAGYWDGDREEPAPTGILATGDLGYVRGGELYVVGRKKELIIVRGQNFIPEEIELMAGKLADTGIQNGAAAVGLDDPASRTQGVHILIEARSLPVADQATREEAIREGLASALGLTGVTIHWISKGGIPKTTSGKIQRFRCRELVQAAQRDDERAWRIQA